MLITVTRRRGGRALRVAVPAIAFLDSLENGTAIRLIGGETLEVSETIEEIEQLALPPLAATAEICAIEAPSLDEIIVKVGLAWREHFAAPGAIDAEKELAGIDLAEGAGLLSTEDAMEQRVDVVKHRGRGRR